MSEAALGTIARSLDADNHTRKVRNGHQRDTGCYVMNWLCRDTTSSAPLYAIVVTMTSQRHHCRVADSARSLLPCSDSSSSPLHASQKPVLVKQLPQLRTSSPHASPKLA